MKKPILNKEYQFEFLGGLMLGHCQEQNMRLTLEYNEPWYWMLVKHEWGDRRTMRYPVPLKAIKL